MNLRIALAAAATAACTLTATAADLTGKITLKGTPPAEKELPLDATCGKLWSGEKPKTRFYVVGADNGLADTFVYIKSGLSGSPPPPSSTPGLLDQKGCEYTPYISGLQVGQKLVIKNSDPVLHNVHATPAVNKEFNLAQIAGGKDIERTLDKPEVLVRFKCDVHPWMFAYIGVVDHPFFAVSDKDGNFTIKDVPPGKYVVEAFHRKGGKQTAEVTVGDAGAKADFTMEVAAQ